MGDLLTLLTLPSPETTAIAALLEAPFSASGFPAGIATRGTLSFTADDLAHALFTIGRAPGDQARHGAASLWEFIHRATLVPAYLRRTRSRAIHKSALAQDLDRSEKVGLSYALGQAVTPPMRSRPARRHDRRRAAHADAGGDDRRSLQR